MSRLEALDFIIKVLQEHERELDYLLHRLDRLISRLETLEGRPLHRHRPRRRRR